MSLREAVETYRTLLQATDDRHFSSVVRGIDSFIARHNLAVCYDQLGDSQAAEKQWRLALQESPGYPPALQGLAELNRRIGVKL